MMTYDHYHTVLGGIPIDLYFYFDDHGHLVRCSFSPCREWDTICLPRPGFIKNFASFLKGRRPFDHNLLRLEGSPFQMAVWRELLKIPRGKTLSYGEIAEKIHRPRAYRAVGSAVGKNPFAVIIPCHRALHAGRKRIGKFGGGELVKKALLENEGIFLPA